MTTGTSQPAASPRFGSTVILLLRAAGKRAAGRRKRQQELLNHRARKNSVNWGWFGFALMILLMAGVNIGAAILLNAVVREGERFEAERHGKIVVSDWFLEQMALIKKGEIPIGETRQNECQRESHDIVGEYGNAQIALEKRLRESVRLHGTRDLVREREALPGLGGVQQSGRLPAVLGSLILAWWFVMLVFQGEGLELDLQRRRHPMWEWLLSHPVAPGAVFMAEMLSPLAANPIYYTAPLFAGVLYGLTYGLGAGVAATCLIGIPLTLAAACLGKALEIGVILRFPPRSRGALIGLMSWLGYASMVLLLLAFASMPRLTATVGPILHGFDGLTFAPWPWLGLFLGQWNGSFPFLSGLLTCWGACAITIACAVGFSVWGAQQGLCGNFGSVDSAPVVSNPGVTTFGREPLYRKEFLWFVRDRSALVQTILIPLTISGVQLFNMRGLLLHAQDAWNYLSGAAILFGTYFLWILGPKSLASEGTALWIPLTWPKGMESLLKAKAWLWSLISTGIVALILLYAAYLFPRDAWKILLVGIGWFFFGRSMAEKTVTLVRVPSDSGEPEKISRARQWAASLGMLTFSIGIFTQQWHVAVMGIVYSYVTAAAMWENFRARLPFLYDPWSETLPPPPTLMHAMVAISVLVEGGAVLTGIAMAFLGRENLANFQVAIYAFCSVIVSVGLAKFLRDRGVPLKAVCCWSGNGGIPKPYWCGEGTRSRPFELALALGVTTGLALGVLGLVYLALLGHIPALSELIHQSHEKMAKIAGLRLSYFIMAVGFAPFAEEYLFRGLLFRALDREWGGWQALLGSALFFAIYHPVLSWLPVGCMGLASALLFKGTGWLAPSVLLHMAYNIVICSGM